MIVATSSTKIDFQYWACTKDLVADPRGLGIRAFGHAQLSPVPWSDPGTWLTLASWLLSQVSFVYLYVFCLFWRGWLWRGLTYVTAS